MACNVTGSRRQRTGQTEARQMIRRDPDRQAVRQPRQSGPLKRPEDAVVQALCRHRLSTQSPFVERDAIQKHAAPATYSVKNVESHHTIKALSDLYNNHNATGR